MIRAGEYRHRVTLQERTVTRDALGGESTAWVDVMPLWAKVQPRSGREVLAAQAIRSQVTHTISIRWQRRFADPQAMAARRIVYNGRIFAIHASIDVDERHIEIELSCSEGMSNG